MKKLLIIVAMLVTLPAFAKHVDLETAKKAAATFLNNNGAKATQLTDLSKAAGFQNLYIFNAEPGFVVMAADDCVKPILGYSLTGVFDAEDMPGNVRWWLQGYNDEIQLAIEDGMRTTTEVSNLWKDLTAGKRNVAMATEVVTPLIQTKWNQGKYYNALCPAVSDGPEGLAYTGCVATSMAQVMKYWEHPKTGTGSYSYTWNEQTLSASFETEYDWDNMMDYYGYYYANGTDPYANAVAAPSNQEITAVATLMSHCGISVDMNYGGNSTNGSSASTMRVADALRNYFNYSPTVCFKEKDNYTDSQWEKIVKAELDAHRPLEYCGSDPNSQGGHAFVCDGYNDDGYFHFNWGWSGKFDGYFLLSNLDTGANNQSGSGNGVYTRAQGAVFGVEPASTLSAPSLTANTHEGIATLSWNPIEGAISYSVFKDNECIIENQSSTTYSDGNLSFGVDYEYYVRAFNGSVYSNPSNSVTVNSKYRNITPSNLTASLNEGNVSLNWTGYDGGASTDLHYGIEYGGYVYGSSDSENYWGQKFPSATLVTLGGMMIEKVSIYLYYSGEYTLSLYSGGVEGTSSCNLSYTKASNGFQWTDFRLPEPISIDITKDLWVVFHCSTPNKPATLGDYDGEGAENASYFSSSLATLPNSHLSETSWMIRTYITDGTFTYNLYDGEVKVNGDVPINGTSYTIPQPSNGIHQYTVKTAYFNGESNASNNAGITMGNASLSSLDLSSNDAMILAEGSTLTVNGTLNNPDPANLVIEDGAQLIHPNSEVKATLKKTINAFTTNKDGWYTIASPVDELGVSLATTGDYDLYAYDEKNMLWLNQENTANSITQFAEGQGFLYANAAIQSLSFAGDMRATDATVSVPLSYQSDNTSLKGFNLVGNPFTRSLQAGDIKIGNTTLSTYYVVEGGSELETRAIATAPIKPGQGFLVQANAEGQDLVFNPSSKDGSTEPGFISIKTDNHGFSDRIYVQIGEGNTLHKMSLNNATPRLSALIDNDEYASVTLEDATGAVPLMFRPDEDGLHTLTFELYNLESDYLHLIDHIAGADIDLNAITSYSFEAKVTDYPSRFQLVFSEDANPHHYFYGHDFIDGKTQILDITGRVVATDCNTTLAPGIYLLRTINGKDIKTEKIIIK